jgi:hypothetical protein
MTNGAPQQPPEVGPVPKENGGVEIQGLADQWAAMAVRAVLEPDEDSMLEGFARKPPH